MPADPVDRYFDALRTFVDALAAADKRGVEQDDELDLLADRLVESAIAAGEAGVGWFVSDTDELRELLRQRRELRRQKRLAQAS
jgi:hypothetical protein